LRIADAHGYRRGLAPGTGAGWPVRRAGPIPSSTHGSLPVTRWKEGTVALADERGVEIHIRGRHD